MNIAHLLVLLRLSQSTRSSILMGEYGLPEKKSTQLSLKFNKNRQRVLLAHKDQLDHKGLKVTLEIQVHKELKVLTET